MAAAAISMSAFAQQPKIVPFNVGNEAFANGMSRNGRWATFQVQAGSETSLDVKIIDLTTGECHTYTPIAQYDYRDVQLDFPAGSYSMLEGVSDDGKLVYGTVNGYPAIFNTEECIWRHLSMGDRTANRVWAGEIYGSSADGSVMIGWFMHDNSMTSFSGGVWKDKELLTLNNIPGYDEMLERGIIDKWVWQEHKDAGKEPNTSYRYVSADGNRILIGLDHNYPNWGCSYGVYDLEKDTFDFILAPESYGHSFTDGAYMSDNGKWVAGNIAIVDGELQDVMAPYLYNVDTKEITLYTGMSDRDILVTAVGNDGTVFGTTPESQPIRNMVIRSGSVWVDLAKIFDQKYGINYQALTGMETTGYAVRISSDDKKLLSQAEFRGGAFGLEMPVNFAEAALGVTLLNEYAVAPSNGCSFSRLTNVQVRFPYEAVPAEGAKAELLDSKGNVVVTTSEFIPFSTQNLLYTIRFPETVLNAGETYTVRIPAGSFKVPDTDMGSVEVTVSYVGRADAPVAVTNISPADGADMIEFSFNSPLTITFDSQLTLSSAVKAYLYQEGQESPLSSLSAQISGNRLSVYPASARKMSQGVKYRVEIPAGLVYDLGSSGPNEAISLNINGTYLPDFGGGYLFYEDFSSPGDALANALLYDGDKNYPNAEMEGFGFDNENTPWNFSIRDDASSDYCAMSHSTYSPKGKSDDWMMTRLCDVQNADYYLTFKGQRYKQNAADVLSIYVWEYDEYITSLDEEMMKKIKAEAKLFQSVPMPAPVTEGLLEGSWQDFSFSLAEFEGKKIYIALVNENEAQSGILIDDFFVEYRGDITAGILMDEDLVDAASVPVKVSVATNNDDAIKSVKATLTSSTLSAPVTFEATDLNVAPGTTYTFEFPSELPLEKGKVNNFDVSVTVNETSQNLVGKVRNHAFDVQRRVLIEESTGMWCGNCPRGEVALENLEQTMPESVAIVSIHNDDDLVFDEYDKFTAPGGYPAGRIDRSDKVFSPLYSDPDLGESTYTSPNRNETFMDEVLNQLEKRTEAEIKIENAVYFSADGQISIPVNVRFSLDMDNASYSVFTVIVEDGLSGRQENYFVGSSDPLLAWWAGQPKKTRYTYNNVACGIRGDSFYGESGRVPKQVKAGENYYTDALVPLPANIQDPANMHFVVALLDGTTGKVVNSDVCKVFSVNDQEGAASVSEITTSAQVNVSVVDGTILINGVAASEVYDLSGARLRNASLAKGLYIARQKLSNGETVSTRVVVR